MPWLTLRLRRIRPDANLTLEKKQRRHSTPPPRSEVIFPLSMRMILLRSLPLTARRLSPNVRAPMRMLKIRIGTASSSKGARFLILRRDLRRSSGSMGACAVMVTVYFSVVPSDMPISNVSGGGLPRLWRVTRSCAPSVAARAFRIWGTASNLLKISMRCHLTLGSGEHATL